MQKIKLKRVVSKAIILIAILAVAIGLRSYFQGNSSTKVDTISIAVPPLEQNALLYVAAVKDSIHMDSLKEVKPKAVNITR